MKKKRKISNTLKTIGILSSSFLLHACETTNSIDELNLLLSNHYKKNTNLKGVPLHLALAKTDQEYITFLQKLSIDIIKNPDIANEFANNPNKFFYRHGYKKHPNIDNSLIKFILALGNKNIVTAIQKGDVNAYIAECKKQGIINLKTLRNDSHLQTISNYFYKQENAFTNLKAFTRTDFANTNPLNNTESFSAIYGFLAVVIAAVAVETAVVIGTTVWVTHVHQSSNNINESNRIERRDIDTNQAIELWNLKDNDRHTYIIADKINDAIVSEGMKIIKDNFPKVFEKIDKQTLKNIILLNVQKNTSHEN